ncbi:MAG: hypothetical protein LUQ25_03250 [Methanoregulaceae archaeon]|nr:hypothetical protein [Methanoregulaceae archaeon]
MKIPYSLIGLALLAVCVATAAAANTTASSDNADTAVAAAAQVYVSGVELDPPVFYPGEAGTVTVHVTNSANQAVTLGNPTIIDSNLNIYTKNSFQAKTNVGPGSTVDFIFLVSVDAGEGKNTFFPMFTASPMVGNSIHGSFKLVTDSREIQASISSEPDAFTLGNAGTVELSIVNPRDGVLKNIMVTAEGSGLQVSPSKKFISSLGATSSAEIPFSVTPDQESDLTFTVSYQAGDNTHTVSVVYPVRLGEDKTAAVPIINNVAVSSMGSYYDMTGDVTNAGISDAKGLVISVGSPAQPTGKYQEYAVGSLASDDSSSFELTFTCQDLSQVPVILRWKDENGNNYATNKTLNLQAGGISSGGNTGNAASSGSSSVQQGSGTVYTGSGGFQGGVPGSGRGGGSMFAIGGSRGSGLSAFYPVIAGAIILVAAIVLYVKRKPIRAKLAGIRKQKQ